jgi:hypothetical protein
MVRSHVLIAVMAILATTSALADSLDDQIKAKEAEIASANAELTPLLGAVVIADADLRVWLAARIFNVIADAYNKQPNHGFHYQATSEQGQLQNSNGGALGCGWYVEVQDGNRAQADMTINNMAAKWSPSGSEAMSVDFAFQASAQIHGHVKGPAGPCSIWKPWPTCDCPIGGGFGSSVGTSANKSGNFAGAINFTSTPTSWLSYAIEITSPSSIPLTIEVSLQYIGTIGIPVSIGVPNGVMTSGSAASVFAGSGTLKAGQPPILNKRYDFTVTPTTSIPDATGYAAKATAGIVFH